MVLYARANREPRVVGYVCMSSRIVILSSTASGGRAAQETDAMDTLTTAADVDFAAIQPEVDEGLREDLVVDLAD